MYNRYEGNTGRFVRVEDAPTAKPVNSVNPVPFPTHSPLNSRDTKLTDTKKSALSNLFGRGGSSLLSSLGGSGASLLSSFGKKSSEDSMLGGLGQNLGGLIPKVLPDGLETEDLILLLILYLMYRETGDKELLIIIGALFFL